MKTWITLFCLSLTLNAGPNRPINGWFATDTGGRSVSGVSWAPGDIATLAIPSSGCVAFLVKDGAVNLTGKTITATLFFSTTGAPNYATCYSGGCPTPANFRLFFSTHSGRYNLNDADRHPLNYWWAHGSGAATVADVDSGTLVTLTLSIGGMDWSSANGQAASSFPAEFASAAANTQQVGFSFGGGCFFDTGVQVGTGTAQFHLVNFNVQ